MDKATVKARVEEIQQKVIDDLEQAFNRDLVSADIDENETKDPEDYSHQQELNQMARTFELRLNNSRNEMAYLKDLSTEALDTVGEGALVETEQYHFYISIPTNPFKFEGRTVVGISNEAPIYKAMRGKKEGDAFSFGDKTYKIVSVK